MLAYAWIRQDTFCGLRVGARLAARLPSFWITSGLRLKGEDKGAR